VKRILLGFDASPAAERALERAAELAETFHCPVVVASVAPVYEYAIRGVGSHFEPAESAEQYSEMAEKAVSRLREHEVSASAATGIGHAAETLVELADAKEADLIVVGMSSRDVITRFFGGVSDDVAHEAHCDVLLVR
jgi:nucleotide-binding universal stress UspA family protein